jgi:ATP-dependent DNA helicase RecQ
MVDGIVKVLAAWGWKQRPTAVVSIGSHTRPGLIADTARRIAAIGRLEYLGVVEPAATGMDGFGGGQARRGNSAQRLKQVHDAFTLAPGLAETVAAHQGPILLVDDRVDTGWTMTVAARMLRQAGADEVLPFALALEA